MDCQSVSSRPAQKKIALVTLFALILSSALSVAAQSTTGILLETWNGIGGVAVSNLTSNGNYPNNPSTRTWPGLFESPTNVADNYGMRARAYVTPPTTGNYTFWIAGDDNCELWLSTDANPANIRRIALVPDWTNSREWAKFGQQASASIALTAGQRYYIEALQKEGAGGDNLAVGWQGPGISGDAERPIPANRLTPWVIATAPAITTQPANVTVNQGQTATFFVVASGTTPTYQWRRNGSNISGATSSSYTTPATSAADNGAQFSVVVSNSAGNVTSNNAVLTVNVPPTITSQPLNQTVTVGQAATFSVSASGTAPLTYQWRRNGSAIGGATSQSYTTPGAVAGDNGVQFSVVVSNVAGNITSANAILSVNLPPTITTQPVSQTVNVGQTATFFVVASGSPTLTYQWLRNGFSITGATAPSYTTPPAVFGDHGAQFSVMVINSFGIVTSNNATLSVTQTPPDIIIPPAHQTALVGQTATFSVTATGSPTLTYQWRRNGTNIPGATNTTYTTPTLTAADNGGMYSVVVTNPFGSIASQNGDLTVLSPAVIVTQPANRTVNVGQTAAFTVTATGSALTYQWRRNGAAIPGATSSTYTTAATVMGDNGAQFSVVVSNALSNATSANALLTVLAITTNSRKIAISGELMDASGNPLGYPNPVNVDAVIRLMSDSVAGTTLYTEEFRASANKSIRVSNGLFVARLGEGTTTGNLQQVVTNNAHMWVEITIDDGSPDALTPRTPLTASAYALGGIPSVAASAQVLQGAGNPNTLGMSAEIGSTYVNTVDNTTWFRLNQAWKLMD